MASGRRATLSGAPPKTETRSRLPASPWKPIHSPSGEKKGKNQFSVPRRGVASELVKAAEVELRTADAGLKTAIDDLCAIGG